MSASTATTVAQQSSRVIIMTQKWITGAGVGVVFLALCWWFPLFRIVKLETLRERSKAETFDAESVAAELWQQELPNALSRAASLSQVSKVRAEDPAVVKERYGRRLGISRAYFLLVRGEGTIISVGHSTLNVSLEDAAAGDVELKLGPVLGNAVRDSVGFVEASQLPNAQQFNDLGAALSRQVETSVISPLKEQAKEGRRITFVGCAQINNEQRDWNPLRLVPIQVSVSD